MGCGNDSRSVGIADKPGAEASLLGCCCTGHAAAKDGRAKHGPFQAGAAVDVSTGHTGRLTCGDESRNSFKVDVQYAASEVRFDPTEVLSGQGEHLNSVKRWRVESF